MEAQKTTIRLADGSIVDGLLNWAVIYRLENSGKFDDILSNFMRVYQYGINKDKQYMDMITVLYTAYLGANYNPKGGYMEFETFLEALPFINPAFVVKAYSSLFYKKKQDSVMSSREEQSGT